MFKKFAVMISLGLLLVAMVAAIAAGNAGDPLVSLSYLTGTFSETLETRVEEALDASDTALLESVESGEGIVSKATTWTETRLKQGDFLYGTAGTNVLMLAGTGRVIYDSGAIVDVTTGTAVQSGTALVANHRYMVAEETAALFEVTSKTAVLDYLGEYSFVYSEMTDYNAMASALKKLHLFKGSFTGYGEGFDLEVAPTRLQALIMFIRVLGEEEEALAWTGTMPFTDIAKGTQAEKYVGYAYSKGYTNGYTPTQFRPSSAVNAYQYTEFMLRAMGYSSAANTSLGDTLERAQLAGLLTESEAARLKIEKFLRADLVYISYYALETYLPDGVSMLADQLMTKGVFTDGEWSSARLLVNSPRI